VNMKPEPVLDAQCLTKRYGATYAIQGVSLDLAPGEIVGLIGDNGAGKSTLVKVLSGVVQPDTGSIEYLGEQRHFHEALTARTLGIEAVHQDLGLCDNLAIYQNVFLGREITRKVLGVPFVAKRSMRERAENIMREQQGVVNFSVNRKSSQLSGGQRQLVALARAEVWDARLMLLDEPTAALSAAATAHVISVIRRLRDRGTAVLLISHNIPQVLEISDRVIVMRQGQRVATRASRGLTTEEALGLMTGAIRTSTEETR
jgi:simple sugar transport system ATP-binding protein